MNTRNANRRGALAPTCRLAVLALGCALALGGCDGFLDEDSRGLLTPETFFRTPQDLEAGVVAVYAPFVRGWTKWSHPEFWAPLQGADDIRSGPGTDTDVFNASANNGAIRGVAWQRNYEVVLSANAVLENVDRVQTTPEVRSQASAEVRFLRALAYFHLVRVFGDVPLMTATTVDMTATRAPVRDVYRLIVEDLQFAEGNLPSQWPGNDAWGSRPTRWAAKALLAEVYLTMAGWPIKDASFFALARDKAREVMQSGQFELLPNFADLWTLQHRKNREQVFAFQHCKDTCSRWEYASMLTGSPTMPVDEGGWGSMHAEVGFFERFPEGPRKRATFQDTVRVGTQRVHFSRGVRAAPYYSKWRNGTLGAPEPGPHAYESGRAMPILRFPHVLTTFAEADAMAGGPSAAAYDAVDAVRLRAGLPRLTRGLSREAFRDSVIAERGWEFAGEFTRWFDLVRTERVEATLAWKAPGDPTPQRAVTSMPKEHFYLMPIPQSEILLNPALTQNPGY